MPSQSNVAPPSWMFLATLRAAHMLLIWMYALIKSLVITGGTGRLFFEFFRILSYVRLVGRGEQPLFWLYENVVSMRAQDKQTISRFLQVSPPLHSQPRIRPTQMRGSTAWSWLSVICICLSTTSGVKI